MPCSRTPARTRFSTYSRLRSPRTTHRSHPAGGDGKAPGRLGPRPRSPPGSASRSTFHALSSLRSRFGTTLVDESTAPRGSRRRSSHGPLETAGQTIVRRRPARVRRRATRPRRSAPSSASRPTRRSRRAGEKARHHHPDCPGQGVGAAEDHRQRQRPGPGPAEAADEQGGEHDHDGLRRRSAAGPWRRCREDQPGEAKRIRRGDAAIAEAHSADRRGEADRAEQESRRASPMPWSIPW